MYIIQLYVFLQKKNTFYELIEIHKYKYFKQYVKISLIYETMTV